jgi:thioredoxin reductase
MDVDVAVVGAGPAGLSAATVAALDGARVVVLDENPWVGGSLGWQIQALSHLPDGLHGRAFEVAAELHRRALSAGAVVLSEAAVLGIFEDNILGITLRGKASQVRAGAIVLATGAYERSMAFPGWTLPGVMKSSAAQILLHIHRYLPGLRALIVGSDNSGLDTAIALGLVGCQVLAVIEERLEPAGQPAELEALRQRGVDVLCQTAVKSARGRSQLRRVTTVRVDEVGGERKGSDRHWDADLLCLAAGWSPLTELAWIAGCEMLYVAKLDGFVPVHGDNMQTSVPGVFAAGAAAGEWGLAAAILSGQMAGRQAARLLRRVPSPADVR